MPDGLGVEVSVLGVPEGLPKWNLVGQFMRLRKEVFLDRKGWPLYEHEGMEFEQYDTVRATYVVAHIGNDVLGGARLLRTTHSVGSGRWTYSYMIRDACRGLLPGLPTDLCDEPPPVDATVWELSRLATQGRADVASTILLEVNRFLKSQGAARCLFLAAPAVTRVAARMGRKLQSLGATRTNESGSFVVYACDVI